MAGRPPRPSRPDRRFKDPSAAPPIVSEKRLTFFLSDETYRILREQTGYYQVANAQTAGPDAPDRLPETPSALIREAIEHWLDRFRPPEDRSRPSEEWDARIEALQQALTRLQ